MKACSRTAPSASRHETRRVATPRPPSRRWAHRRSGHHPRRPRSRTRQGARRRPDPARTASDRPATSRTQASRRVGAPGGSRAAREPGSGPAAGRRTTSRGRTRHPRTGAPRRTPPGRGSAPVRRLGLARRWPRPPGPSRVTASIPVTSTVGHRRMAGSARLPGPDADVDQVPNAGRHDRVEPVQQRGRAGCQDGRPPAFVAGGHPVVALALVGHPWMVPRAGQAA